MIEYKNNHLYIEDIRLSQIAKKYGTPVYCYSASIIEKNFDAYLDALKTVAPLEQFTIAFACKANSNLAVMRLLQRRGAGADIVSGGELKRALRAGISPAKIVFSGVGKSEEEIREAIENDIFQINVESAEELETISKIARNLKKTAAVAIRVNPDIDAKTHAKITTGKKENKFGISFDDAPALFTRAKKLKGVEAVGVACHIGSQLTSLAPFSAAYKRMAALVKNLRKQGHQILRVDLGGGIGITYKNEQPVNMKAYVRLIRNVILPLDVHVILEPGRSIVGNAGVLVAETVRIKKTRHKRFLVIDAGMNDLIRPAMYDAYHAIIPCKKGVSRETYDIVGPICETSDCFLTAARLPKMKEGDLVAIMSAGAYGAVMSSNYNTHPLAPEVLVKDKKISLVRKIQTIDEVLKADIIPVWLRS